MNGESQRWQFKTDDLITKVGNFDIEVFVEKKILGLEVPVDNHVTMAIIHSRDDLLEKPTCFRLFQLPKTPDELKIKISSTNNDTRKK